VSDADERQRPFRHGFSLEIDHSVLGHTYMTSDRGVVTTLRGQLEDYPAAPLAALLVGRRQADERLASRDA